MFKVTHLNWHNCFLFPRTLFLLPHSASEELSEVVAFTRKMKINKAAMASIYNNLLMTELQQVILFSSIQFAECFWLLNICLTINLGHTASALKKRVVLWVEQACTCCPTSQSMPRTGHGLLCSKGHKRLKTVILTSQKEKKTIII